MPSQLATLHEAIVGVVRIKYHSPRMGTEKSQPNFRNFFQSTMSGLVDMRVATVPGLDSTAARNIEAQSLA